MLVFSYNLISFVIKWGIYGISLYFSWKDSVRLIKNVGNIAYDFSLHCSLGQTILNIVDDYFK